MRAIGIFAALLVGLTSNVMAGGLVASAIYPAPTTPLDATPLPPGSELITATTTDGLTLKGLLMPPAEGMPVVLGFPGNASGARDVLAWSTALVAEGYGVLGVGYRGYNGNPGEPSEAGLALDADAFMAELRARYPDRRVWTVGHSLGGGVALALAVRLPPDGVVTWGTFTSLRDMVPNIGRFLVPDAYRNDQRVAELRVPLLLIHGIADDVVPAGQGESLHKIGSDAGIRGASFVGTGLGHAPDAAALAAVIAVGERLLDTGSLEREGLPDNILLIPFGQSRPLALAP